MAVVLFLSVILIRSFLTGVIGVEPLSAYSAARFWGACGNTKAMLATLRDREIKASASAAGGIETILLSASQKVQKRSRLHTQPYQRDDFSSRWHHVRFAYVTG